MLGPVKRKRLDLNKTQFDQDGNPYIRRSKRALIEESTGKLLEYPNSPDTTKVQKGQRLTFVWCLVPVILEEDF